VARAIARGEDRAWIERVASFAIVPHAVYYLRAEVRDLLTRVVARPGRPGKARCPSAFPMIEDAPAEHHARQQVAHLGAQVIHGVWHNREAGHPFDPGAGPHPGDGAPPTSEKI